MPDPAFAEVIDAFAVTDGGGVVGGSPLVGNVMVRMQGLFDAPAADTYDVEAFGGTDRRLFVDGGLVIGPLFLTTGSHAVDARFAVDGLGDLPLSVLKRPHIVRVRLCLNCCTVKASNRRY